MLNLAEHVPTLASARRYCQRLARQHYENFTVVSWLLPRRLHQHFYNVYAYCRWADDLADEVTDAQGRYSPEARRRSLQLLGWWREQLLGCYADGLMQPRHPVLLALSQTIRRFSIPPDPFLDLLLAFEQDQRIMEYETYGQLLGYCRYSANPVGRLVLYLCEAYDEVSAPLSDAICTGLQLANFWQDVRRDLDRGRIYLPREDRLRFSYDEVQLRGHVYNEAFCELMRLQVERARHWFDQGMPLVDRVPLFARIDIELFLRGGLAVLDRITALNYDVWTRRPALSRWDQLALFVGCLPAWLSSRGQGAVQARLLAADNC